MQNSSHAASQQDWEKRVTMLTFELLRVGNINFLQIISTHNQKKRYENQQNDHCMENALTFYWILSTIP